MSDVSSKNALVCDDTAIESKLGNRVIVVIPVYNDGSTVAGVIAGVLRYCRDVVVVDDGSTDSTFAVCSGISSIIVLRHEHNRGKGAALRSGFAYALKHHFTHAITVDADGQHLAEDLPLFLQKINDEPQTLWVGARVIPLADRATQPSSLQIGRRFWAFWYKLYTGSPIQDTQSGFRSYPLAAIENLGCYSERYQYEIEVLICAAWSNTPVKSIPVHMLCQLKKKRLPLFRSIRDFIQISVVNGRAVISRVFFPSQLINVPGLRIRKKLSYLIKNELTSNATPFKAALSFGVGVTIAVSPFHGFQVLMLLVIAFLCRLNRPLALLGVSVSSAPLIPFWIAAGLGLGKVLVPMETAIQIAEALERVLPGKLFEFLANKMVSGFLHGFIQWFLGTLLLAPLSGIAAFIITWPLFKTIRRVRKIRNA
ncbi:MAG: DUF2062 domain-containing protein [Chitinispirillaceae bacterium]|nr:DUF2062 domain-containing protein [Chitinispirillaceae bacterium]